MPWLDPGNRAHTGPRRSELFGVHPIKGVWFTDFGMGGGRVIGMARGAGEAVDSNGEIVEDSQTRV